MSTKTTSRPDTWPRLPLEAWNETYATLHLWTQIVGKVRMVQSPWVNHGWHVTLYVTARGLTTSPIPHGSRTFQIDFDFMGSQSMRKHALVTEPAHWVSCHMGENLLPVPSFRAL